MTEGKTKYKEGEPRGRSNQNLLSNLVYPREKPLLSMSASAEKLLLGYLKSHTDTQQFKCI